MQCPTCPLQLVKVAGLNMWVMEEETGDPSSDPPQTAHLHQKVHAQQYTASSSKTNAQLVPSRMTGMLLNVASECVCVIERFASQLLV